MVVASQLRLIAHRKVTEPAGETVASWRGGEVHPSPMLLDRFRSASFDWTSSAAVHVGPVLSESVLVNARNYRETLRLAHPDAIAGEMEGSGIYAAALRSKVNWGLVKGICNWGFNKTDRHQQLAADNAASFVVHAVEVGGLDPVMAVNG